MFPVDAARRCAITRIGAELLPLICIDEFSSAPAELVEHAARAHYIDAGPLYPGVRAPAPSSYAEELLAAVAPQMEHAFGWPPDPELELCAFSMVTKAPDALQLVQRIPHYDGPEGNRFAFLHYLCAPRFGGTSFYRHRSTSFESVTAERERLYRARLDAELRISQPPPGYIAGDTALFERIHSVDAQFNRLVIYQGNTLHSGDIPAGVMPAEDARRGRLTVNGFGFLRS